MWTVLETILLGIFLMYASVSETVFWIELSHSQNSLLTQQFLLLFFPLWIQTNERTKKTQYNSLGRLTFFPSINATLLTRTMVTWAWFYRLLWCYHIETLSSFNRISNAKSTPNSTPWRWFTQIFVKHDICCAVLPVRIYRIINRSNTNGWSRWFTGDANKYMPADALGICYTNQWSVNIGIWFAFGSS